MTNVKPGDIAIIIRAPERYQWTRGRVVEIDSACCFAHHCTAWRFKAPLVHSGQAVGCAPDAYLKRIEPLTDAERREQPATLEATECHGCQPAQ